MHIVRDQRRESRPKKQTKMKLYHPFSYYRYYCCCHFCSVAAHTFIRKLLTFVIDCVLTWWHHCSYIVWHCRHAQAKMPEQKSLFEFRPFELTRIDYKNYRGGMGMGIKMYPKARSGHRITVSDTDVYLFGGLYI